MKRLRSGIWNLKFSRSALRIALAVFGLLAFALFTTEAWARVGGGHSYGGGGGSGGGGGDGGGLGVLVYLIFRFLLWLTIEHPAIGIPVDIIVIGFLIYRFMKPSKKSVSVVSSSPVLGLSTGPGIRPQLDVPRAFNQLRRFDPNFSEIIFTDAAPSVKFLTIPNFASSTMLLSSINKANESWAVLNSDSKSL